MGPVSWRGDVEPAGLIAGAVARAAVQCDCVSLGAKAGKIGVRARMPLCRWGGRVVAAERAFGDDARRVDGLRRAAVPADVGTSVKKPKLRGRVNRTRMACGGTTNRERTVKDGPFLMAFASS